MNFDLIRPCAKCPFRCDIPGYLTEDRVTELEEALERSTFSCHKTVDYSQFDDGEDEEMGGYVPAENEQHCAGALILMEKEGRASQMMRIAERLGMYDARRLDMEAPVYDTWDDMRDAMPR